MGLEKPYIRGKVSLFGCHTWLGGRPLTVLVFPTDPRRTLKSETVDKPRIPHATISGMKFLFTLLIFSSAALCIEVLYDGRAKPDFDAGVLDNNSGPYLAYVIPLLGGGHTERFRVQRGQGI